MRIRSSTRDGQTCQATSCTELAILEDEVNLRFYCEPCAVTFGYEPQTQVSVFDHVFCDELGCNEWATLFRQTTGRLTCNAHRNDPQPARVIVPEEAVQAEVGAAVAAAGEEGPPPQESGTPGGDYLKWADGVPAPDPRVPIAFGSGWASGFSAGWKAGQTDTIARAAGGTL